MHKQRKKRENDEEKKSHMNAVIQAQIHHHTLFHTSRNHQHHQASELPAWMGRTGMITLTLWLVILLISVCVPSSEGVQTEGIIRETISCSNVTLSCFSLNTASYKEEFQTIAYRQT